ncbi:ubiquitin carboxyl-terminal hydrolase 2 isoform X2 [Cryptomeria japonica]|uniref:ubiquitin carboxyl-terminal hydrolase 2 isoform X2 n=1 Tax=Cryptomeria japonica TaxID=3369 RepID=UPI0025AD2AE0|nr:ubiquitin carboxyl-terminal hydrolase 2 isoform X2 [Cryptomeria japonica]
MDTQSSSGTAVDNSSAAESSGKHVEWAGKPCQHLEKGIDLEKLEQYISRVSLLQCQGCGELRKGSNASASKDKKGKSKMYVKKSVAKDEWLRTWMCLACGHVGCSSISNASEVIGTGHTWKHWLDTNHPYAVQWGENVRCWCFSCKALLEFGFLEEEENKGLVMVGPSAGESMLQALKVVQEKLVKESVKFREIRLTDAIVEKKPLPSEEDGGGSRRLVKGLMNLGNTCFFNSVLQNLLAIGVLQDHFSRPAGVSEGRLTSCLRTLYATMTSDGQAATDAGEGCSSSGLLYSGKGRALWENRNGIVNPGALFSAVCDQAPSFRGFHQQDSQEFLLYLLDCLNTEELNARKLQNTSFEMFAEKGDDKTKEPADSNGDQTDKFTSFFSSVFGSELSSTICCSECGHSSVSFESFLDLSLAMPAKPKPSSSKRWASSSVYTKRLTKIHDDSRKDGQRTVEAGLSSLLNISEVNREPSDEMEETSCSLYKSIAPGADARETNKSDFPENFGWMDFLDAPAQSADMVIQDTLNTSEIMEVLAQEETSMDVSEVTSMGQLSTSTSAFQNQDHINQNAVFSQTETSEKNLSTTEGDFGTNDDQDMMHVSDWEDNHETGQEEELLQMVGDSEVLFLPYKDIDAADEGSEALGYFQNLSLGSPDGTLDKQSGDAPDVIDGDFDGFAEMFNEEENSFFQKFETEVGDNFQLNEGNGGDDIWDIELAVTTEEGSETNKEGPEGIIHPISLDGCLTAFTRPELLSGENAWECENCSSKILNDSCKWCVGVSKRNKQIQYKQTVISTLNDTGTYEEQVHLVNGGGSISFCKGAVDTNLSKIPEKQTDLSMLECNGLSNIEGEIDKHYHLKSSRQTVNCHTKSFSLGLTEKGSNLGQHVARISDLDSSQPYIKQCCLSETEFLDSSAITLQAHNSCPDDFSGQGNCGEKLGRSFDEDELMDNNAETRLPNDKSVTNTHLVTCSQIGKSKQSSSVLGRYNFDSIDCIYDGDKLQNGNMNLSLRGTRLDGSLSKENEKQPKGLKRNATKVLLISKAPLVLTIHLKRFGQDMLGRLSKLSGHVTFHNKLDLRPFLDPRCPDKESCIYHLIGVVEHSGSMRGGHYVAYVRGPRDEKMQEVNDEDDPNQSTWYCISDSSVRKISFSEVLQREAYLLFYEKDVL